MLALIFLGSCTKYVYIRERYPEIKKPTMYLCDIPDRDIESLSLEAQRRIMRNFAAMSIHIMKLETSISIYNDLAKAHNASITTKEVDKLMPEKKLSLGDKK